MKMLLVFAMILSTILVASCEKEVQMVDNQSFMDGYVINYGTSFGMCVGACRKEIKFENDQSIFTVYTSQGRGAMGGTSKEYIEKNTKSFSNELLQNIDYDSFINVKKVIGCPDCADGGAEWVEIIKGDSTHKVTFEFGKSPKEIEKLVKILREKRVYFEEKYLK